MQESPLAWMYKFGVCDQNSEEEDCLSRKYKGSLQKKEACIIKLDLHIRHLFITQRLRRRDKKECNKYHAHKV